MNSVRVRFRNPGQTPAYPFRMHLNLLYVEPIRPGPAVLPGSAVVAGPLDIKVRDVAQFLGGVGSGGTFGRRVDFPVDPRKEILFRRGSLDRLIVVRVDYKDAYGVVHSVGESARSTSSSWRKPDSNSRYLIASSTTDQISGSARTAEEPLRPCLFAAFACHAAHVSSTRSAPALPAFALSSWPVAAFAPQIAVPSAKRRDRWRPFVDQRGMVLKPARLC